MKIDFLSKQNLLKLLGDTGADVKRFADCEAADLAELVYDQIVRHVYPESGSILRSFGIEPSAVSLKALLAGIDSLHARLSAAEAEKKPAPSKPALDHSAMLEEIQKKVCVRKFWICNAGIGMFWQTYEADYDATATKDKFAVSEYYDTLADCIECEYAGHVLGQPRMSPREKRGNRPAPRGPFYEEAS